MNAERLGSDRNAHLTPLAVRVGMHTGPVVIADGGEVFGETANVAARVQGAAEPDTVVVTAATQRLVPGIFVLEDRGPQALKGVREPVPLYRVVQPSGVRSRLAVAAGRLTPFVGREVELATLVERWERAADGEGQNVLVVGEAGVGKSRLAYQLRERLATIPHTWLECGASPYTEGTPFHPVIALVAQGLAFTPADTVAEKIEKIERGLARARLRPENVALLADFLGLPPPTPLAMNPDVQRRKTMELLAQWNLAHQRHPAARAAGRGPALVRRLVAGAARAHHRPERHGARALRRDGAPGVHGALAGPVEPHDAPARAAHEAPGAGDGDDARRRRRCPPRRWRRSWRAPTACRSTWRS